MLMFLFLFGCVDTNNDVLPPEEEVGDEVIIPSVEEVKLIPKLRFIDYPLELNAKEGAHFVVEVKDLEEFEDNVFVYIWEESVNPSKFPTDYVYYSDSVFLVSNVKDHYETYIVIDEPGEYYARSLVVVDGEYYWSEEAIINVLTADGKNVKSFDVEITSSSIIPENINVNKGDIVVVTFEAGEDSHENGVRILSPGWKDSPSLKPGQTFTVEFTAENSFTYRMFWLAGNLLKGTGTVTVN
jgi:hypothetical protein